MTQAIRIPVGGVARRRGLFLPWTPGEPYTRDDLVGVVRAGMRGFWLTEPVTISAEAAEATVRHLGFLRDAAGVGLRVVWRGSVDGMPTDPLRHLDPPRARDGAVAWPVPRRPMLTVRHGPEYALVEDWRSGDGVRRTMIDDPHQTRALADPNLARVGESRLSADQRAAVNALAVRDLFLKVGSRWLALPVRFRYARS